VFPDNDFTCGVGNVGTGVFTFRVPVLAVFAKDASAASALLSSQILENRVMIRVSVGPGERRSLIDVSSMNLNHRTK